MRIATFNTKQQAIQSILNQEAKLSRTQAQISASRNSLTPSDNPAQAAQELGINQQVSVITKYQANIVAAKARLGLETVALGSIKTLLNRVKELGVQAGSSALSEQNRRGIATEVRARLSELIGLANTKDGKGDYLFAGGKTKAPPFSDNGSGVFTYNGNQNQRSLKIDADRGIRIDDSGTEVFQRIRNGNGSFQVTSINTNTGTGIISSGAVVASDTYATNSANSYGINFTSSTTFDVVNTTSSTTVLSNQTYTPGGSVTFDGMEVSLTGAPVSGDSFTVKQSTNQSVFDTLWNFIGALETSDGTAAAIAQRTQKLNTLLSELPQAIERITLLTSSVGARVNTLDSQNNTHTSFLIQLNSTLADLDGFNLIEASTRLSQQTVSLQAAQQAFVKVQNLSLFKFIRL